MTRHSEYGLTWELDPDEKKGQLGLLREDHYRSLFIASSGSFKPTDVWLDIGANIGAFALRAAPLVQQVIAIEPDPVNLASLRINRDLNGIENVPLIRVAIFAGRTGEKLSLALSNSFSSTHRIGTIRGRKSIEVTGINIDDAVAEYRVNKIKMDCESAEADILEKMNLEPIEEIVFEYHFAMLKDYEWTRFYEIMDRIATAGFTVLKQPALKSKTWHTIVWAQRR